MQSSFFKNLSNFKVRHHWLERHERVETLVVLVERRDPTCEARANEACIMSSLELPEARELISGAVAQISFISHPAC
jgi:hypothetical protein